MGDFFSITRKISRDHGNLAVANPSFLHQSLDLMDNVADLSRRIRCLKKGDTFCLFPIVRVFRSIAEQILFQPGKFRMLCETAVFLIVQHNVRQFFYLVFLRDFRQAHCHLATHIKEILHPHSSVHTRRLVCRHSHKHLFCVNKKQFSQTVLNRRKARIAIQGNDAVPDQL